MEGLLKKPISYTEIEQSIKCFLIASLVSIVQMYQALRHDANLLSLLLCFKCSFDIWGFDLLQCFGVLMHWLGYYWYVAYRTWINVRYRSLVCWESMLHFIFSIQSYQIQWVIGKFNNSQAKLSSVVTCNQLSNSKFWQPYLYFDFEKLTRLPEHMQKNSVAPRKTSQQSREHKNWSLTLILTPTHWKKPKVSIDSKLTLSRGINCVLSMFILISHCILQGRYWIFVRIHFIRSYYRMFGGENSDSINS